MSLTNENDYFTEFATVLGTKHLIPKPKAATAKYLQAQMNAYQSETSDWETQRDCLMDYLSANSILITSEE